MTGYPPIHCFILKIEYLWETKTSTNTHFFQFIILTLENLKRLYFGRLRSYFCPKRMVLMNLLSVVSLTFSPHPHPHSSSYTLEPFIKLLVLNSKIIDEKIWEILVGFPLICFFLNPSKQFFKLGWFLVARLTLERSNELFNSNYIYSHTRTTWPFYSLLYYFYTSKSSEFNFLQDLPGILNYLFHYVNRKSRKNIFQYVFCNLKSKYQLSWFKWLFFTVSL